MATLNPRRFAQPDTLKSIAHERLVAFLTPFAAYLAERELVLPDGTGDEIDYGLLSSILMSPDEKTPPTMADALYFICEMSTTDEMDRLLEAAKAAGLTLDDTPESSPADIAVQVWLQDRELLERQHAEIMVHRPKSFEYFGGKAGGPKDMPEPTAKELEAIQADLDAWFSEHKRGTGSKVFVFPDEGKGKAWILVRHGMSMKREGATKDGESSSVYYRPEVHDVLIYDTTLDEIGIHTGTKGERTLYREVFGSHLFDDSAYFPDGEKFTLQPLIDDGAASMVCTDVDGIEWMKLKEVQRYWGGTQKEIETRRADDLFAAMATRPNPNFDPRANLIRAVFLVKFEDAKTPRTVTIRPKNIASCTRDEDGVRIEKWLMKRGFALAPEPEGDEDEPTEAALADA